MSNNNRDTELSFEAQAAQAIKDEAQKIANGIQKPGQSKEETKLIAQGIAKGIEIHKKQEKAKQRERDKEQKKLKAQPPTAVVEEKTERNTGAAQRISKLVRYASNFAAFLAFLHFWAMLTPRQTWELNLHLINVGAATLGLVYLVVSFLLLKVARKLTN